MALFTLAELTSPLTRDEVKSKIYEVLGLVGTRTTSWKPGAVVRTMITAVSIILSSYSELQALIAKSGFLELATGRWLALVAWYVYGVEKYYATFATGAVTLTNTGGGLHLIDPGDLIVSNPDTGKQYRNTTSFTLNPLESIVVDVEAVEAGSASTSAPGTVVNMITPLLGVSVTNEAAIVGTDDEADTALRARCSEKLGSLSPNGPWDAYSYVARNARREDGSLIGITRVRTKKDAGTGTLSVYVATATGTVPGPDLVAVNEAIQRQAVPLAVTANVASATTVAIAVSYRVSMYNTTGLTLDEIEDAIALRLVDFFAGQPIGGNVVSVDVGFLYVSAIEAAIASTFTQIFEVEVTVPNADVELDLNEIPALGLVTPIAITQVPPSEGSL